MAVAGLATVEIAARKGIRGVSESSRKIRSETSDADPNLPIPRTTTGKLPGQLRCCHGPLVCSYPGIQRLGAGR